MEPALAFDSHVQRPPVPGAHVDLGGLEVVGERALPEQPEVREDDRFVDAEAVEVVTPDRRVPEGAGQALVVGRLRRHPGTDLAAVLAHLVDVARVVDFGDVDAAVTEHQPGVAEVVVGDAQGLVALAGIGVVGPEGSGLVEMRVGVHHRHVPILPRA